MGIAPATFDIFIPCFHACDTHPCVYIFCAYVLLCDHTLTCIMMKRRNNNIYSMFVKITLIF